MKRNAFIALAVSLLSVVFAGFGAGRSAVAAQSASKNSNQNSTQTADQTADQAARPATPPAIAPGFDASSVGTGAQTVTGNWRVHYGDNPGWAAPDFDDSSWAVQPADKELNGDRKYVGFLWYRMKMRLPAHHGPLGVSLENCLTSFEVFANGRLVGRYGGLPPHESRYQTPKVAYSLGLASNEQTVEIAIRVWAHTITAMPGLRPSGVRIGDSGAIAAEAHAYQSLVDAQSMQFWIVNTAFLLVAFVVLALFAFQPGHKEYLWLAAWQIVSSVAGIVSTLQGMSLLPYWTQYNVSIPLQFVSIVLQLEFYCSFVGVRPNRWIRALQAFMLLTIPLGPAILYGHPAPKIYGAVVVLPGLEVLATALILIGMLAVWFRRGNREAGLLLIPTALANLTTILNLVQEAGFSLGWLKIQHHIIPDTNFGDYPFSADTWSSILYFLAILGILLYRFLNVTRQQTESAAQIEAARQVQQVLLPEELITIPGIAIESEYHPADVVGGDFFQVIPTADGSLLVVVGDVAGKGMGAAMLVGVIVGTLRTAVQFDADPTFILNTLNDRLCGRVDGAFVTCLAALLNPDGALTLANAGHLSPYLNGEELATIPELPLGVAPGTVYRGSRFVVAPGDRLTFVSDGVVEATKPGGELFGFDRTRDISRSPASAIAAAAKAFGQTDDITVVTLTRDPLLMHSV